MRAVRDVIRLKLPVINLTSRWVIDAREAVQQCKEEVVLVFGLEVESEGRAFTQQSERRFVNRFVSWHSEFNTQDKRTLRWDRVLDRKRVAELGSQYILLVIART